MAIFNRSSDQRGALMIEVIALLGLMTMMSPMIVRQTAERTTEMEDVTIAGQVKTIRDALQNYIEANYAPIVQEKSGSNQQETFKKNISVADLMPFLPASFIDSATNKFYGNKLMDDFHMGAYAQCSEKELKSDGTQCSTLGPSCKCTRYRIVGIVLAGQESGEIPDKRAARIASMLGADGGYMRTAAVVNAIAGDDGVDAGMKKVLGSQGMWEVADVNQFFEGEGIATSTGGRVAMTTVFSTGLSSDYLYRHKVNGMPDANSMFTDLDMGGNGQCDETSGDGKCNRINNAGGVEVINGRLIVRKKNQEDHQGDGSGDTLARIALGTEKASMQVEKSVTLSANKLIDEANAPADGSILVSAAQDVTARADNRFLGQAPEAGLATPGGSDGKKYAVVVSDTDQAASMRALSGDTAISEVRLTQDEASLGSEGKVVLDAGQLMELSAGTGITATANVGDIELKANSGNITADASANMTLRAGSDLTVTGENSVKIGTGDDYFMEVVKNPSDFDTKGDVYAGSNSHAQSHTRIVGGLHIDTASNTGLTLGGNGQPTVLLQSQGITMQQSSSNRPSLISNYLNREDVTLAATGKGGRLSLNKGMDEMPRIRAEAETGVVSATAFESTTVVDKNSKSDWAVRTMVNLPFDSQGNAGTASISKPDSPTFSMVINTASAGGSKPAAYSVHGGDTDLNTFRVDPAFISVMNDIKLTSRGGARLSETLPNYIAKGIYVLSNSYTKGPWPCGSVGTCTYTLPTKTDEGFGLFSCDDMPGGTATCSGGGGDTITINQNNGTYVECSGDCLAHPFMGVVPAPGRQVQADASGETMAGWDEGTCPDGYVAVMTLTPSAFELGEVKYVKPTLIGHDNDTKEYVSEIAYNQGYNKFEGVFQPATALGVVVEQVGGTDLKGWKVAMGTVTGIGGNNFIWNYGGIYADTWTAYAHTYCYFNPTRFTMPNMKVISADGGSIITPMSHLDWTAD